MRLYLDWRGSDFALGAPFLEFLPADLEMHGILAPPCSPPDPAFLAEKIGKDSEAKLSFSIAQSVQHSVDVQINSQSISMRRG